MSLELFMRHLCHFRCWLLTLDAVIFVQNVDVTIVVLGSMIDYKFYCTFVALATEFVTVNTPFSPLASFQTKSKGLIMLYAHITGTDPKLAEDACHLNTCAATQI